LITVTPPVGTVKITEYYTDDTTNEITVIPATYTVPYTESLGITKIIME